MLSACVSVVLFAVYECVYSIVEPALRANSYRPSAPNIEVDDIQHKPM